MRTCNMQQLHVRSSAVVCRCVSEQGVALDTDNALFCLSHAGRCAWVYRPLQLCGDKATRVDWWHASVVTET